jgi:23S rRNA (guanine745-N1)-methyltransferase
VNLLLAQHKRTREPGDSPEMVRSRSRFLDRGYYAPLAAALVELVVALGRSGAEPLEVLDSGCGEGYFLARLREGLEARGLSARLRGIDVSRPAIRVAARRDSALQNTPRLHQTSRIDFAVASVHRLPIAEASLDLVLRVLAPLDAAEFLRVLSPSGVLLSVTPGPDHLLALRRLVYETPRARVEEAHPVGFTLLRSQRLAFPIRLDGSEAVRDLLAMTPYYWRASQEVREAISGMASLETAAEFVLSTYARSDGI